MQAACRVRRVRSVFAAWAVAYAVASVGALVGCERDLAVQPGGVAAALSSCLETSVCTAWF
jgi:hypothetical protein